MERRFIICNPEICTGCGACEIACSLHKEGVVSPMYSRIHVSEVDSFAEPISSTAIACFRCEDPACAKACPGGVLSSDEETGLITVEEENCGGAMCCGGWAEIACEFGAISMHPEKRAVLVCDGCPEKKEPPCVEVCPKEALSFGKIEEVLQDTKNEDVRKLLKEFSDARKNSKTFYERLGFIPIRTQKPFSLKY
jgi:Fe-S-cluster-containing dehydrogenase component